MELKITGTNIELQSVVQRYVERKLGKLDKHFPDIIDTRIEISEEKTRSPQQHYLVKLTTNSSVGGATFHAEDRGEDLYKAIDKVASVVTRQLERHKGKLYDKGRGSPLVRGKFNGADIQEKDRKLVKTKRFVIQPMSFEDAVEQMGLLGHSFFLYIDAETEELRLVYRRNDSNYGLIVPEYS